MDIGEVKVCTKCGVEKPRVEFRENGVGPTGRVYRQAKCRGCSNAESLARYHANPSWHSRTHQAWRDANPEKVEGYSRKHHYKRNGTTLEEYEDLLEQQGRKCANPGCQRELIAGQGLDSAHQDHDHTTRECRGILCHGCNTAIGFLREDSRVILGLAEYLDRWPDPLVKAVREIEAVRSVVAANGIVRRHHLACKCHTCSPLGPRGPKLDG